MDRKVEIESYAPEFLKDYEEIRTIYSCENIELEKIWKMLYSILDNAFVETANEYGVERWESIIGITANKSVESIQFRKERILNRLTMMPPFTIRFLRNQLDTVIGIDKYEVYVDYANYTLYLESSAINQNWYEEISFTINKIKPANIVFINKPLLAETIHISEHIESSRIKYNYIVGNWKLGERPFIQLGASRVIKGEDEMSVKDELLNGLAITIKERIKKVLINDNILINTFSICEANEQNVTLEYTVSAESMKNNPIINIKLLDDEDKVLSESKVYVSVESDTIVKHTMRLREGV